MGYITQDERKEQAVGMNERNTVEKLMDTKVAKRGGEQTTNLPQVLFILEMIKEKLREKSREMVR
jgi:hypothetical protein